MYWTKFKTGVWNIHLFPPTSKFGLGHSFFSHIHPDSGWVHSTLSPYIQIRVGYIRLFPPTSKFGFGHSPFPPYIQIRVGLFTFFPLHPNSVWVHSAFSPYIKIRVGYIHLFHSYPGWFILPFPTHPNSVWVHSAFSPHIQIRVGYIRLFPPTSKFGLDHSFFPIYTQIRPGYIQLYPPTSKFGLGTFGFFPLHLNSGLVLSAFPEFWCRGKKPNVPNPNCRFKFISLLYLFLAIVFCLLSYVLVVKLYTRVKFFFCIVYIFVRWKCWIVCFLIEWITFINILLLCL